MSYLVVLIVSLILIYATSLYLKTRRTLKLLDKIPSPPGLFLFGNILDFADPTKILEQFLKFTQTYGGLVRTSFLWFYTIIVTDPKAVEEILSTTKILHKSEEYEFFEKWLGTGLLTSRPEKWKKTRKIITPTFHFQILDQFMDIFDSCSGILVENLRKEVGKPRFDIYSYITLCTLDIICESAMGTKVHAQENSKSEYVASVKEMSRILRERLFNPVKMVPFLYIFTADCRKEKAALKLLHSYTSNVIEKRRKELANNVGAPEGETKRKKRLAFLDLLLQSSLDGRPITDYEIRQEVDTFMFEGHDTTSSALSSTFFCLGHNQVVQDKAVLELKEIFGDDRDRPATHIDLQHMKYLEMVIKEALRIYPPVPMYGRKVVQDVQFGDGILPKDVTLAVFPWGLHRNPDIFPNPQKFDPERFTLENQNKRNPFSYVPFSAGPRNCIGQRFAMLEMKSTVSRVLRNFEVHPVPNFEPVFVPDLVLKSLNGIEVCLKDRRW